jgi:hypothetical protein
MSVVSCLTPLLHFYCLWYYTHLSIICVDLDPGTHMRCIWFLSRNRVWQHTVLIRHIEQESLKETPQNLLHGKYMKRLRKSPKRKNGRNTTKPWGITSNHLYIPWKVHTRSSFCPIILPSDKISPWSSQARLLVLEIPREKEEENSKTKWARLPRDGCHPITPWVIWRQADRLKYP